jgi:hypothetical protein
VNAVTFPALDGASKEPALMSVEFAAPPDKAKQWLASNFRVEIGSLPCERVARIDAFTWTCAADGTVSVPDVRLVVSRADLGPWEDAARRWFLDRDYRDKHEMNGRITLLAADGKGALATIELGNVGLKKFSHDEVDAGTSGGKDAGGAFAVELYAEKLGLTDGS